MHVRRGLRAVGLVFALCFTHLTFFLAALAQQPGDGAALAELHQQYSHAQDPEVVIAAGEQILALEPKVTDWSLSLPRESLRADVLAAVGQAYINRSKGVRADNIERAIASFEAVLAGADRQAAPDLWANAHNDTGVAYFSRLRGERAQNLEKAISHFEAALQVFSRDSHPDDWAALQSNLGSAYLLRVHGEPTANIERAIGTLEGALSLLTRDRSAAAWARAKSNLGNAYRMRRSGDSAENVEAAITQFEDALQVFTQQAAPFQWAQIHVSLAMAYEDRKRGNLADNVTAALRHVSEAQKVFTREAAPAHWAAAQIKIGDLYANQTTGDVAENRKLAIAAYAAALTVQTKDADPRAHFNLARTLAQTLVEAGDCASAGPHFASSRDAFTVLFGQGLEDADTNQLVADAGPMFAQAAYCAAELGNVADAVQLASESRARLLSASLKLQTLALSPEQHRRLDDLRVSARALQAVVGSADATERDTALRQLIATRQELLALIASAGPDGAPAATAGAQAQEAVGAGSVLLMPVVTQTGGKMLMFVGAEQAWHVIDLPKLTLPSILGLLATNPGTREPGGWIEAYFANYFVDPEEQRRRWPQWLNAVDGIGGQLWQLFGEEMEKSFKAQGIKTGARLIVMPAGRLGIFPLGLAQNPRSKRRLIDDFEIVSTPSLDALVTAHRASKQARERSLVAVVNPTGDLPGTEKEGEIVASHFAESSRAVLIREAAGVEDVLAALKGKSYWHFASHGTFNWQDVRNSGLVMRGDERLSISRLAEAKDLGQPRLVVLSACETGLSNIITRNPDEFIGLPNSFAALGAVGIVGTLWPVSDSATALLIAKFYDLHLGEGLSPPAALRQAQLWLRDASRKSIDAYAARAVAAGRLARRHLVEINQDMDPKVRATRMGGASPSNAKAATAQPKPFAHPYYWGGFVYTGL